VNSARARVGKPPLKGISWINRHRIYKTNTYLFTGFEITAQNLKQLDVAIDMHISMVQMRQYVNAGLAEGKDLRQVVQDAIETVQNERAASGAEELRLGFRSQWKRGCTPTTHDLGRAIQDWRQVRGLEAPGGHSANARSCIKKQQRANSRQQEKARPCGKNAEQREKKLTAKQKRQEQRNARWIAMQKRQEVRRKKRYSRLRAMVLALQARFQKLPREKMMKAWGIPELPEGLQVNSFQSPDDSLCVTLHLSDGTEAVGPYRKNFRIR
jgi:hypothetical protein